MKVLPFVAESEPRTIATLGLTGVALAFYCIAIARMFLKVAENSLHGLEPSMLFVVLRESGLLLLAVPLIWTIAISLFHHYRIELEGAAKNVRNGIGTLMVGLTLMMLGLPLLAVWVSLAAMVKAMRAF